MLLNKEQNQRPQSKRQPGKMITRSHLLTVVIQRYPPSVLVRVTKFHEVLIDEEKQLLAALPFLIAHGVSFTSYRQHRQQTTIFDGSLRQGYVVSLQMASADRAVGYQKVAFLTFCHCQYATDWLNG
jgi:hypothetical protein